MASDERDAAGRHAGRHADGQRRAESALGETSFDREETLASSPGADSESIFSSEAWVGRTLGKYQVTAVLGLGGMGVVLKARDPLIERDVAIKVLAEQLAADEKLRGRFLAEARAAGQINHPHVANIYEVGQEGNNYYLVMEYVPGGSLADRLEEQGAMSVLEATQAMVDACRGIAAAHAAGLIHRDVKPANFMRAADGSLKVTDFGLAKAASTAGGHFTHVGMVIGTPFFMSPEQCQGAPVDLRSDIYSLGATYYSLLTAARPYEQSSGIPQLMFAHCHAPVPDPRKIIESTPPACARIIAKAMAKAPAERYQTVDAMLSDLLRVVASLSGESAGALPSESASDRPTEAPTRWPAKPLAVGAALLVLLAAALVWWRPWQPRQNLSADANSAESKQTLLPSGAPIKIGVLHSLSGTMAGSESVVVDAVLFAIEEVNRGGGVLGRPLQAVVADGQSDPEVFAREAERLIVQEQVATVFGCWTSASRKTVLPVFEEYDHLLIYPLQYEGLEASPNVIYLGAAPNQQILPAVEWAITELGKKRFFLVGSDYVFPRVANEIIKDHLQRLDAEVVGERYLPLGSADAGPIVEAIAAAQPEMILNTINGDSNTAFFRLLRAAKITAAECPTLSFSVGEQELRSLNPLDVEADYAAWTYFQSVDTVENRAFVERFHNKYPQRTVTDPMATAYASVQFWAAAVGDAQSLQPGRIRRAMLNQRLASPAGELRLDPDTQHCFKTPRIGQYRSDGQFHIVWEANHPVRPEPFPASRTATEWAGFLHDLYTGWGGRWSAP